MEDEFDIELFKHAIGMVESQGGKLLDNKTSSAAGKYHFLYDLIKGDPSMRGISKREFMNNPKLQEKVMDKALRGTLHNYGNTGYINDAIKNKSRFQSSLKVEEIAALQHFLGRGGVKKYLRDPGSFSVPGVNYTPEKYLTEFNGHVENFTRDLTQFGPQKTEGFTMDELNNRTSDTNNPIPFKGEAQRDSSGKLDLEIAPLDMSKLGQPRIKKKYSDGGSINTEGDEGLIEFANGGTHEQNPLGGIPLGTGEDGIMSTVEEDETKFKFDEGEYIFTARIGAYGLIDKNKK